ncbi:hypothetical protein D4764_04G0011460 [Takifugu flavidus]|uniref:Uncharacterized protein n=1 Tax=Takifugu flavidus TaxID=433684 RepID=A0A5C6N6C4_9TELE|nr:hypothetical protein D4764_04G0011460 [Takifugu flavidus]
MIRHDHEQHEPALMKLWPPSFWPDQRSSSRALTSRLLSEKPFSLPISQDLLLPSEGNQLASTWPRLGSSAADWLRTEKPQEPLAQAAGWSRDRLDSGLFRARGGTLLEVVIPADVENIDQGPAEASVGGYMVPSEHRWSVTAVFFSPAPVEGNIQSAVGTRSPVALGDLWLSSTACLDVEE